MQDIFRPYLDNFVLVFFDDILVYSKSLEEHEGHVRKVLQLLRENKLYAKKSKCTFCTSQIEYLGFIISEEGIYVDSTKVKDILDWPIPTNFSEVRGFLGITGWYRVFIQNYAVIASPLTELLKKGVKIIWNDKLQASFDELKRIVTLAPCLKLPDFTKEFEALLMQAELH